MADDSEKMELGGYRLLVSRVDELAGRVARTFSTEINCRPGCSGCCRHLTLFPVEAMTLLLALENLTPENLRFLADRVEMAGDGPCPLLKEGLCLAYDARPIICRTHGLPLLTEMEGEKRVDFCPENFRGTESLPGSAVLNLDILNQTLVAVNAAFLRETADPRFAARERFSIAHIVSLALGHEAGTNDAG